MSSNRHANEAATTARDQDRAVEPRIEPKSIDAELALLRSRISEIGDQIDMYKAKTAACMGGGVFLFLLAALAAYDIMAGKAGLWMMVGVSFSALYWMAFAFGAASLLLLIAAARRSRRRDRDREAELEALEEEYAELLDRKDAFAD